MEITKTLSEEFLSSGGFGTKAAGEYVAKRDDRYRIPCVLIGLEQDAYANRILFLRDGAIFTEIRKGGDSRRTFFEKILDVLTMMGGGVSDVR